MMPLEKIFNTPARIQELLYSGAPDSGPRLFVLRLDEMHEEVSGNKPFKLYYYLKQATDSGFKVLSFGGSHSNHLAALASACQLLGLPCIGLVRGNEPFSSHTLQFCKEKGMELIPISRELYRKKNEDEFLESLKDKYGPVIIIPEGGYSLNGKEGAAKILEHISDERFTHVCCSAGTGTTLAGLSGLQAKDTRILGFSALKGYDRLSNNIQQLLPGETMHGYEFFHEYHFGGFAKKNESLLDFMNELFVNYQLPTDFVYTAKMFHGVFDLLNKNYFPFNSKILCIHTGGLQGNLSLPPNRLLF